MGLDPAIDPSYIGFMQEIAEGRGRKVMQAVGASIALHALVAAIIFLRLPLPHDEPPKEEVVDVQIVNPPEPPPEKTEPEKKEEAKKEEAPPEEKKPEEKKAEEKKAEEQEQARTEKNEAAKGRSLPSLQPVVQFGEEDSGPRQALDGSAAAETPEPPAPAQDQPAEQPAQPPAATDVTARKQMQAQLQAQTQTQPQPEEAGQTGRDAPAPAAADTLVPEPDAEALAQAKDGDPAGPAPGAALQPQIAVPDVDAPADRAEGEGQAKGAPQGQAAGGGTQVEFSREALRGATGAHQGAQEAQGPQGAPAVPTPKPQQLTQKLTQARTLFSAKATGGALATTAMKGLSRNVRVGQLCTTELREQLKHAAGSYRPEILPSYGLSSGTVLDVRQAAFRAEGQWYDVSFRCEIDAGATKIVSFAYQVGEPVPRAQWRKRGFPDY